MQVINCLLPRSAHTHTKVSNTKGWSSGRRQRTPLWKFTSAETVSEYILFSKYLWNFYNSWPNI